MATKAIRPHPKTRIGTGARPVGALPMGNRAWSGRCRWLVGAIAAVGNFDVESCFVARVVPSSGMSIVAR
jgi:hypothetical protein